MGPHADLPEHVEAVRRFNRFYTLQIGVLREGLSKTPFSLTEGRVLWELAHREETTAAGLGRELGLDAGYLSRILNGFQKQGLIDRRPSKADGRQSLLRLAHKGREAFAVLDGSTRAEIAAMLGGLPAPDQGRLIRAMETIRELLGPPAENKAPYLIRTHQPGDMGWVVHRHGVLYAEEYGWDERFEALVARIVAQFIEGFDPKRERCWIAEKDGGIVGSVFLVKESETVAKLRLLLVEPKARGLGLGGRLVDECIRFARRAGYKKMVLWTNDVLVAARRIYERAGFRLVHEEPHHSFGSDLVGQTWELEL
jgi:DNA-binding MarR family transcriptional regulator/GNAT superfamily N-acetyltransferase